MKRSSSWIAVLPSLVIPVCIGMMMYLGLQACIKHELITNESLLRYLTGHPVLEITIAMFFVGLASLLMIANNVFEQFGSSRRITIGEPSEVEVATETVDQELAESDAEEEAFVNATSEKAARCAESMMALPDWMHDHYLWQRITNALQSIFRTSRTDNVEDELKYLSDLDLERQSQRYALVRILIWATPMLGFLGTVLGISQALGGISVGPENDFQQMMNGLRGSLYVAFDTTALALTLSMVLMFGQFLIDRFESQLLELVDQRTSYEIGRHFDLASPGAHENEALVLALNQSTESQTKIWRQSISAAEKAWASSLGDVSGQVQENLTVAIDESVSDLAHYLGEAIEKADDSMAKRWEQWQVTLSDNAKTLSGYQQQLTEQASLMSSILEQKVELEKQRLEKQRLEASQEPEMASQEPEIETFTPLDQSSKRPTTKVVQSPKAVLSPGQTEQGAEDQPRESQLQQELDDEPVILKFPTSKIKLPSVILPDVSTSLEETSANQPILIPLFKSVAEQDAPNSGSETNAGNRKSAA